MTRPPEPSSPAEVAAAAQYRAAAAHTEALVAGFVAGGVTIVPATGPWARSLLGPAAAGRRACCPHLVGGPRPRFTLAPSVLVCETCFRAAIAPGAQPGTCGRCGKLNALRPMICGERLTVAYGRLCWFCVVTEQAAHRGTR